MTEQNPYAAPAVETTYAPERESDPAMPGLWRDKRDLVMHKDARLPNLCVLSGEPTAETGVVRKFYWHNPWIALTILLNLLIFLILAWVLTHRATIEIPLSAAERQKRRTRLTYTWLGGLTSLACVVLCIYLLIAQNPTAVAAYGTMFGFLFFLGSLLYGQRVARIVRPTRITKTHVWLRGVHANILDQLPPLPQE